MEEYLMKFVSSITPCGMPNLMVYGNVFKWGECEWRFVKESSVGFVADDSMIFY